MRILTSLEKKAELKLAKRVKSKTHFQLKEILLLMELHRKHSVKLDEMEKTDFISLINSFFKFDDKIILERIFQVFNTEKVKLLTLFCVLGSNRVNLKKIGLNHYLGWSNIKRTICTWNERISVGDGEGANPLLLLSL